MVNEDLFVRTTSSDILTDEELRSCFERIKCDDREVRDYVIEHNIGLVIFEVRGKFGSVPYEQKELVSASLVGLIKAVDTFDISRNIKFATYAARCIDNEIRRFMRKESRYISHVQSLETPLDIDHEGNTLTIRDIFPDVAVDFVSDYEDKVVRDEIRKIVYDLPDREREIILQYFYYNDGLSIQDEIFQKLSISQSYLSRLIRKGLIDRKRRIDTNSTIVKPDLKNDELRHGNDLEKMATREFVGEEETKKSAPKTRKLLSLAKEEDIQE